MAEAASIVASAKGAAIELTDEPDLLEQAARIHLSAFPDDEA